MKQNFDRCWERFEQLQRAGEYYDAFVEVAEIFSSLESLTPVDRVDLEKRCNQIPLDEAIVESITGAFEKEERKLAKIVSIGEEWNDDELLVVIRIRIQNDLLRMYLAHRGHALPVPVSYWPMNRLVELFTTPVNHREFTKARQLASKNWGMPIQHPLLQR